MQKVAHWSSYLLH